MDNLEKIRDTTRLPVNSRMKNSCSLGRKGRVVKNHENVHSTKGKYHYSYQRKHMAFCIQMISVDHGNLFEIENKC